MEEIKKKISEILSCSLLDENASTEITGVLNTQQIGNNDVALLILAAYSQGVNTFCNNYLDASSKARRLEKQVEKVKERLFYDYINGTKVEPQNPF